LSSKTNIINLEKKLWRGTNRERGPKRPRKDVDNVQEKDVELSKARRSTTKGGGEHGKRDANTDIG